MMGTSSRVSEVNLAGDFNWIISSKRLYEEREMTLDGAGTMVGVGEEVVFVKFPGPRMVANREQIVSAKISGERRIHSPLGFPSYA